MDIFILLMFVLCAMGILAICSIEPVRRTFLEGMAITVLFGFSLIVAVVIYLGFQAI
ncbi:hypothetical protein [uncultured Roseovarius sp.]|uniref:hypothetical protein n=1 Tax=uncultured Roseovarius sp. TaxID=293344 RepID=UPI0026275B85|nr:hypothetical protein [uncultured Roseovarius sp.]